MQSGKDDETTLLEHAEILVREAANLGLRSRAAALAYVGRSFREAISLSEDLDDIQVCRTGRIQPQGAEATSHSSLWLQSRGENRGSQMSLINPVLSPCIAHPSAFYPPGSKPLLWLSRLGRGCCSSACLPTWRPRRTSWPCCQAHPKLRCLNPSLNPQPALHC